MPEAFTLPNSYWGMTQLPEIKRPEIETIIVQLGRVGDLLNILPVAKAMATKNGLRTRIVTARSNKPIIDRTDYCDGIYWDGDPSDGLGAARMAQRLKFDPPGIKAVSCMFFGTLIHGGRHHRNFLIEQWGLLGYEKEWGRLPLELDRDPIAEAKLMKELGASGDYVVLSLESYSSPCPVKEQFKALVLAACDGIKVIDVGNFKTANFVDMLGLLEHAKAVITVDSAIIHLNRATKTPAVLFGKGIENKWHMSHNVENVKQFYAYEEFTSGDVVKTINEVGHRIYGLLHPKPVELTVVTGGDDNFRQLSNLCRRSLDASAISSIEFCPLPSVPGKAPSWWKLRAVLDVLDSVNENEWVMWIDADCVVKKGPFEPRLGEFDMMISQDWNGPCMGIFACRNTDFCKTLLKTLLFLGDSRQSLEVHGRNDGPKWEQDCVKTILHFFPSAASRIGLFPASFTTDHPLDDTSFCTTIHHWGGRPLNFRVAGMTGDLGYTAYETLITFCYLPPRGVGNNDEFLSNLTDWEAHYRVVFLSDSLEWKPNRVIPRVIPGRTTHDAAGQSFERVMRAAEDYGSEYFMVIEPDCRVKGDGWDKTIFDQCKASNPQFVVAGTPVVFHSFQTNQLLRLYRQETGIQIQTITDEDWLPRSKPALFPNGAFAIYRTKEAVEAWKIADKRLPWDMALGMAIAAQRRTEYVKEFSLMTKALSFSCEAWITRENMKRQLDGVRFVGIHNIKDDWKPTK